MQVIPAKYLRIFTPDQFSLLLSGIPTIDVEDWKKNTEVHSYVYGYSIASYPYVVISSILKKITKQCI